MDDMQKERAIHQETEKSLLDGVAMYRAAIETSADGFWLTDTEGRILDVNETYVKRSGYSRKELQSMRVPALEAKGSPEETGACFEKIVSKGSDIFETLHRTKVGTIWHVEVNASYWPSDGGRFFIFLRDISDRKRVEEQLEQYHKFFNSSSDFMCIADQDYNLKKVNPTFIRTLGYTQEELCSHPFLDFIHPEDRQKTVDIRDVAFSPDGTLNFENRYMAKDGSVIWLSWSARPAPDENSLVYAIARNITKQKHIENALIESNYLLSSAARIAHLGTWKWNLHDSSNAWSDEQFRIFGVPNTVQPSSDVLYGALHPEDRDMVIEAIELALAGVRPYEVECRVVWPCGELRHVYCQGEVQRNETGLPISMIGTVLDITDRKRAEIEREQFYKFFQTSADLMVIADPNGAFKKTNPACTETLGYSETELVAKPFIEFVHPEDKQPTLDEMARQLQRSYSLNFENRFICKDGTVRWLSWRATYIKEEGITYATARDITELKKIEKALRTERELLQKIFDTIPVMLTMYNPKLKEFNINKEFERVGGYSTEDIKHIDIMKACYPDPEYRKKVTEFMSSLEPDWQDFTMKTKDGKNIETTWTNIFLSDKTHIGIGIDITERKRAEEGKTKLEAQLHQAQKMESVGRLAGGVAHDFNNMLCVILGHAELALMKLDPSHPLHADLTEIRDAASHSANLTRQLLAFARKQTVSPKVLDLNETVAGMLKMLKRLIGEDIDLAWHPKIDLWPVNVDPFQIDQILANLCVNARDAISDVGKITIKTGNSTLDEHYCAVHSGFVPGEYMLLAVSDDGCGMDKETLSHIFEPFFTTKEVGKGTGLGLATVYGIVKQNNGFINVHSEPDQGTTFSIYLPRHVGKAEKKRKESAAQPALRGQETILLVEDEPAILNMTTQMLSSQGYTVLAASTPGEAIRLAREHAGEIKLLITDVVMPTMNGRDLAKNLLSLYPNLKRLFMSGYTTDVIAHHGVLDEGVHFIQKPFPMNGLAAKLREVLDSE